MITSSLSPTSQPTIFKKNIPPMKKNHKMVVEPANQEQNYVSQIVGIFSCNLRGIFCLKTSLKNQVASNEKSHVPFIHKAKRTKKKGEGVV